MSGFDHERLDVYQVALAFVVVANDVVEALPRGRGYLADQLQQLVDSSRVTLLDPSVIAAVVEEFGEDVLRVQMAEGTHGKHD